MFSRILDNLLSNAIKFSNNGGKVGLNVEITGRILRIRIKDSGPGISQEDQKKLFQPFQRLSARPTAGEASSGLGLSIVKSLSTKLGGTITCQSEIGEGAQFVLELPL
jgi:signal transduction histidine kinase